jgi:DNA-binding transcriptional regulator YiaG
MQKDLAKEIGRHRTTVQSWERGLWEPSEKEKEYLFNMIKGGTS